MKQPRELLAQSLSATACPRSGSTRFFDSARRLTDRPIVSSAAAGTIRVANDWWRSNRPKDRRFGDDLARTTALLVGKKTHTRPAPAIRTPGQARASRSLRYDFTIGVEEPQPSIEILALWIEPGGQPPSEARHEIPFGEGRSPAHGRRLGAPQSGCVLRAGIRGRSDVFVSRSGSRRDLLGEGRC